MVCSTGARVNGQYKRYTDPVGYRDSFVTGILREHKLCFYLLRSGLFGYRK